MNLNSALAAALVVPMLWGAGATAAPASPIATADATSANSHKPPARVSATFRVRDDSRVSVSVTTNGRRVIIKFRHGGSPGSVARAVRQRSAHAVLPTGSRRIQAKALPTGRLAASGWIAATRVGSGTSPTGPADPTGPSDPADPTNPLPTDPPAAGSGEFGDGSVGVTDQELTRAAQMAVLFGHQSVGMNILDAVPGLYDARGVTAQPVLEWPATEPAGGFVSHAYIGENGLPLSKIADFDAAVRSGRRIEVAVMKLCFVDVTADTDIEAVFNRYRTTMADLGRDRPAVALIYATVPLTVGASQDNAARQRLNAMIRAQYAGTGRLFDLAAIESTRPDGTRVTAGDGTYLTLYTAYASDEGHLNETGARRAAAGLMRIIAGAGD